MVDLNLFDSDDLTTIDRYGGPFDDSDQTQGAYRTLAGCNGRIFYSTAPAYRLLTTIDGLFPQLNLKSAKHTGSGCIATTITGDGPLADAFMLCSLYDGPQGSALACLLTQTDQLAHFFSRFQLPRQGAANRQDIEIRNTILVDSRAQAGAAAAIGLGSVVAPWYAPGFEGTHEPAPGFDGAKDGYDIGVMSADLIHSLASWRRSGYDTYQKSYDTADGKNVNIFVFSGVEHDGPGPKVLFPIDKMTAQELEAAWGGIDRFGPCRPYLFAGIGSVICDLDPHASSDQVDARVHELLVTIDRWLHRHDSGTAAAPLPSPSSTAKSTGSRRLHDALKARLDATLGRSSASAASAHPTASPIPMPSATSPAASAPQTGRRFCTSCGAQLPPNVKFCGQCGTKAR